MSPNGKLWLVALGAALVGAILGAGSVWATQQSKLAALEATTIEADARAQAALARVYELTVALDAANAAGGASGVATPSVTPTDTTPPKKKPTVKPIRQFTYVRRVTTPGTTPVLVADYAQMLTGESAAAAAAARGDESPPPNDYYIVNDNTMLRRLEVRRVTTVTLTTNPDGSADPEGHAVSFTEWAANYTSPTADNEPIRESPYWITITGGVVTAISQQYLP